MLHLEDVLLYTVGSELPLIDGYGGFLRGIVSQYLQIALGDKESSEPWLMFICI